VHRCIQPPSAASTAALTAHLASFLFVPFAFVYYSKTLPPVIIPAIIPVTESPGPHRLPHYLRFWSGFLEKVSAHGPHRRAVWGLWGAPLPLPAAPGRLAPVPFPLTQTPLIQPQLLAELHPHSPVPRQHPPLGHRRVLFCHSLVLSCLIHAVAGRTFPAGERGSAAGSLLSSHCPSCTWACVLCRPSPELPFHFVWFRGWSTSHLALDPSSVLYLQRKSPPSLSSASSSTSASLPSSLLVCAD
jgi:hypothetical protein